MARLYIAGNLFHGFLKRVQNVRIFLVRFNLHLAPFSTRARGSYSRYQVQPGNEVLEASPLDYCVGVQDVHPTRNSWIFFDLQIPKIKAPSSPLPSLRTSLASSASLERFKKPPPSPLAERGVRGVRCAL